MSQVSPGEHQLLKSLLGAFALAACNAEESAAVEAHLTDCASCAEEALQLRDAVTLLHPQESLDLEPSLRGRVLQTSFGRRHPRIPLPEWVWAYDAETARLDALLNDMDESEWGAPVDLRWYDEGAGAPAQRTTSVAGVIGHLMAVDGLLALSLGLPDPLRMGRPADEPVKSMTSPDERTEAFWKEAGSSYAEQQELTRELRRSHAGTVRGVWRDQNYSLIRTTAFAGGGVAALPVPYGPGISLPLRDAFLDRAFECWIHAWDIAEAVDYPYGPPDGAHLHQLVDLAARLLPGALAARRRSGKAGPARELVAAGAPGRSLHLEVEGEGGGDWFIPLDSPAAVADREHAVAHVALEDVEFCRLAAGHTTPSEAAAGHQGDAEAIADLLYATATLSRL